MMPPCVGAHFIVGDFIVVQPDSPVRFDTRMTLKEDYDFTAQHLQTHGKVCRVNRLLIHAEHRTNEGGAVTVRNVKTELANIKHLRTKVTREQTPTRRTPPPTPTRL